MKFGLFGSAQAQRGGPDVDSAKGFRDWLDYNVEAEALGYHSTFAVEHHFTGFGQVSATINLLTYLAAQTSTLRLGTAVMVLPWHNPVLLAEQAATLDLLSGGRLDFGVGKGYRYNEFKGFRIPMEEADARFAEALEVITKAWTSEERWAHEGRYWQFEDVIVEPPTKQKPHPPFWMGAGSPASIEAVAARGCNLLLDQLAAFEVIFERMRLFREAVEARGRRYDPGEVAVARSLYVAKDAADRDAAVERRVAGFQRVDKLAQRPAGDNKSSLMANISTSEGIAEAALYGTIDEIAEKVERLRAGGVRHLLLNDGGSGVEGLRVFARHVMPAFTGDDAAAKAAE